MSHGYTDDVLAGHWEEKKALADENRKLRKALEDILPVAVCQPDTLRYIMAMDVIRTTAREALGRIQTETTEDCGSGEA